MYLMQMYGFCRIFHVSPREFEKLPIDQIEAMLRIHPEVEKYLAFIAKTNMKSGMS